MDGGTRTEHAPEPAREAQNAALRRRNISVAGRIAQLRERLIAATAQSLATARSPRLSETGTTVFAL